MAWLPDRDEQEWTLDCLRLLVGRVGTAMLDAASMEPHAVSGPLELATLPATREAAGRVLAHLGDTIRAVAVLHDEVPNDGSASFARVVFHDPEGVTIAIRPGSVADPARRAADLCRALVGLYREEHRLAVRDPRREGRLTDLTGVWLGLGACLANGADPMLIGRDEVAPAAGSRLSTQAVCFALAARVVARESGCWATWRTGRTLDRVARRSFIEALRVLRKPRGAVAQRLRLPGHERFGDVPRLALRSDGATGHPVSVDEPD